LIRILISFDLFSQIFSYYSYAFFIGDLNFRIDNLTAKQIYDTIRMNEYNINDTSRWNQLLKYDQVDLFTRIFRHSLIFPIFLAEQSKKGEAGFCRVSRIASDFCAHFQVFGFHSELSLGVSSSPLEV